MARDREGALADFFLGNEKTASLLLVGILRAIGHERAVAVFDERRDVYDEAGADVGIEAGVDDLEGSVRCSLACDPTRAIAGLEWGTLTEVKFGEAAQEAGFIAEGGGVVVVGMAALSVGEDDDAGTQAAQDCGDLEAVLVCVFDAAVGDVEGIAPGDAQDASGFASASAARSSAVPRVPDSPRVRSRMAVVMPSERILSRVPPQVCSTSSRWAAMARMSTAGSVN